MNFVITRQESYKVKLALCNFRVTLLHLLGSVAGCETAWHRLHFHHLKLGLDVKGARIMFFWSFHAVLVSDKAKSQTYRSFVASPRG